jgi:DNA-binding GntR family transcriptional regulator
VLANPLSSPTALPLSSVPDYVAGHLREWILDGEFPDGAPLRQEEIAQRLGVSRPPVREALRLLEGEGLTVLRPRRGYVVASLDVGDVEEIFEIRERLEELAGEFAARNRTAADIDALAALVAEMEALEDPIDAAAFGAANAAFHARIFQAAERPRLTRMMLPLRDAVDRYIRLGGVLASDMGQVRTDHRAIFEAFRAGDPKRLGALSRAHVAATGARLVTALRVRGAGDR